ncbi:MAG: hypothetical protein M1598_09125 [Actinobacteria bacterium]|nr:hypothetical protein [Actinomycetota bacterium]
MGSNRPLKNGGNSAGIKRGIVVALGTFFLAVAITFPSGQVMSRAPLYIAFPVLFLLILNGIIFDIIGVAVAVADETPFHAMAAKKIPGARQAIRLIRNADKVSNFCNDIVGDVSGTISGAAGAAVVAQLVTLLRFGNNKATENILTIVVIGLVAALTVGGKAIGKGYAIGQANSIIKQVGRVLFWADRIKKAIRLGSKRNRKRRGR